MSLTATDIKKMVYKQSPKAEFVMIRMGVAYYQFDVVVENKHFKDNETHRLGFQFQVPVEDMGTADFFPVMEAKHLLKWLNEEPQYFSVDGNLEIA